MLSYYVYTFWVPCPIRFSHKTMFGSILPPDVCRRDHVLFTSFVCVFIQLCPTHIVLCFVFFVLCTQGCQFLWIVHLWLRFRYSLTFIYNTLIRFFLFFLNRNNIIINCLILFLYSYYFLSLYNSTSHTWIYHSGYHIQNDIRV